MPYQGRVNTALGWKLLHDEYLEPTGLLPLGEAESLVSSRP